ncbi:hypothetical protein [Adhaeretor mobilis]|uniref:Uncharacterized protein n=1 Tax=Adhaeretor mobilis TaxID=1930276 RepID=A0A517MSL9_9BACT|nr:hypothetical protein [Adhaeretor mobilis]QDS97880.1 hypothetical protein HG15A2_11480 [Adhaeretor mobilis]
MPPRRIEHAGHFQASSLQGNFSGTAAPSLAIQAVDPVVQQLLSQLDSAVFSAIQGEVQANNDAHDLWPQIVTALPWQIVECYREHYLLYAVETSRQIQDTKGSRPESTLAAVEIISLLTRE